jgi:hypothetical protein
MTMSEFDKAHVEIILRGEGDWFGAKLLRLISEADPQHREALRLGFPEEVEAYERWYFKDNYEAYRMSRI